MTKTNAELTEPFDLFSPQFKADPFPTYSFMRQHAPIYPHVAPYGATIWYITRYEDVVAILKDNDRFVKNPRAAGHHGADKTPRTRNVYRMINRNMLFADPPDHTRLRSLVSQAFTPRRISGLEGRIIEIANRLLDVVDARGEMDLIADYAFPLPVTVIMEMLGIPAKDQHQVHEWTKAIIAPGRYGLSLKMRKRNVKAFTDYLGMMFAERRLRPQDDLISALVAAEEAGDRLSEAELSSMVALLFVTGHETVVNLIGNGVLVLLQQPQIVTRLTKDDSLIDQTIEELLRFDGPVETSTTRWAKTDVTIGEHNIKRGDVVRVVLTSANRDATVFDQPDTVDIDRASNPHVAFGRGIHYCLGAPLARLEGRIAIPLLWQRFPDISLAIPAAKIEWHTGVIFRGMKRLPLRI